MHDCMVKTHIVSTLAKLLGSKVKAEVFRLLFAARAERLHLREIARQSGLAVGTVRQELARLTQLGVVLAETDGNRKYYRANEEHLLFPGISSLVARTVGVAAVLQEVLRTEPVNLAIMYNPEAASLEELDLGREVAVVVIGAIPERQLKRRIAEAADATARRIAYHLLTLAEFNRHKRERAQWLKDLRTIPRRFIVGKESDLSEL
jgi:DNA-binding transcriptional ArsR family regulator